MAAGPFTYISSSKIARKNKKLVNDEERKSTQMAWIYERLNASAPTEPHKEQSLHVKVI